MDPNATLASIREMVDFILTQSDNGHTVSTDHVIELCQAFDDLDSWLTSPRGFLPQAWQGS